jgi:hypothetical protein
MLMLVMVLMMLLRVVRSRVKVTLSQSALLGLGGLDSHQEATAGVVVVSRVFNGAQSSGYLEAIREVS